MKKLYIVILLLANFSFGQAGLGAGAEIQIYRRWSAIVQVQYEKQLTPVLQNENSWKPEVFKIGGGVGFRF